MFKKASSLLAVFCLSLTLILPASAQSGKFPSSATIVTEENINQVLESLGLDPSALISNDSAPDTSKVTITVGDLQRTVSQLRQLATEMDDAADASSNLKRQNAAAAAAFCTGNKMIFHTTNLGGSFELTYEVSVDYSWMKFTDVDGSTVNVVDNDDNPLTTFTIPAGGKSIQTQITNNGNKLEMTAEVKVDSYLSIGSYGIIKILTTTVNTSKDWNSTTADLPVCI